MATETKDSAADKKARTEYGKRLDKCRQLKVMTGTAAWQQFYSALRRKEAQHGMDMVTAEKTRDIIAHQEAIKAIRQIVSDLRAPIAELASFVSRYPLLATEVAEKVAWNEKLGIVEITTVER